MRICAKHTKTNAYAETNNFKTNKMDLDKFNRPKHISHWAEELQVGDRCKATIRHKTDGSKNLHNVEVIVVENLQSDKKIVGYFNNCKKHIPYNELTKLDILAKKIMETPREDYIEKKPDVYISIPFDEGRHVILMKAANGNCFTHISLLRNSNTKPIPKAESTVIFAVNALDLINQLKQAKGAMKEFGKALEKMHNIKPRWYQFWKR